MLENQRSRHIFVLTKRKEMKKVTKNSVRQLVVLVNGAGTISEDYLFCNGKDVYYIRFSNGAILVFADDTETIY